MRSQVLYTQPIEGFPRAVTLAISSIAVACVIGGVISGSTDAFAMGGIFGAVAAWAMTFGVKCTLQDGTLTWQTGLFFKVTLQRDSAATCSIFPKSFWSGAGFRWLGPNHWAVLAGGQLLQITDDTGRTLTVSCPLQPAEIVPNATIVKPAEKIL